MRLRHAIYLSEVLVCVVVLIAGTYVKIDWDAYMQEVGGFLQGERVYTELRGETGPLVYPAGFVYLYAALRHVTEDGQATFLAQGIFSLVHMGTVVVVVKIFRAARLPLGWWVLLLTSRRLHTFLALRLFNDGPTVLFAHAGVLCVLKRRWIAGSALLSLAVGMKMSIGLWIPGVLACMAASIPPSKIAACAAVALAVQVVLAWPFLSADPVAYVHRSFDLGRVFDYAWTVNGKFWSEAVFTSPTRGAALLGVTLASWAVAAVRRWTPSLRSAAAVGGVTQTRAMAVVMASSNVVGILCARSLHYQFWCAFAHHIVLIAAWRWEEETKERRSRGVRGWWKSGADGIAWVGSAYAFETYPSTPMSSAILIASLLYITVRSLPSRDLLNFQHEHPKHF